MFVKILLESKLVSPKKPTNPRGGYDGWYGAAVFFVLLNRYLSSMVARRGSSDSRISCFPRELHHILLAHDGYLPSYAYISNGKKHDVVNRYDNLYQKSA